MKDTLATVAELGKSVATKDGTRVGGREGIALGAEGFMEIVGCPDGEYVGKNVGATEGAIDGMRELEAVGALDGRKKGVGPTLGQPLGITVGRTVGAVVGR